MDPLLTRVSQIMDRYDPDKKVPLFVDEWGTWYKLDAAAKPGEHHVQQNSLRDGIVAALTLNIFHRHTDRVKMANIAQMVNVLQAMILTDGAKMALTPTYHVFDMYQPFMDADPYPVSIATGEYRAGQITMPQVDGSAARGTDGKLHLALVNVDPHRAAHISTSLTGIARGTVLTAATMDAHNLPGQPQTVMPAPLEGHSVAGKLTFDLPAKSVAVFTIG
jgi:alpha-N-arabinofuranosidase